MELVGGMVVMEGTRNIRSWNPAKKALIFGGFLIFLQALDGILTSVGVSRFGISVEGNPVIRNLMLELGHLPALGLVKLVAVLVIIGLTVSARRIPWVNNAMGAVSAVYLFAAILPWTYILFIQPYFI